MSVFRDSEELYEVLRILFGRIGSAGPQATQKLNRSRLIIRLHCLEPEAEVTIDGRQKPVAIHYGKNSVRPDLDVDLDADTLHEILMGNLRLSKAVGSGKMKVRGPVLKSFALEEVLHQGQAIYPQIAREKGLKG